MVFGVADYAASTQARTTNIGGANPDYAVLTDAEPAAPRDRHWGDQWHFALSRMVVACRAYGLRPIDGPFGDYHDADGYVAAARRAPRSAARASGRSTRRRSRSRTTSSRPSEGGGRPARAASSTRWRGGADGRAPSRSTAS